MKSSLAAGLVCAAAVIGTSVLSSAQEFAPSASKKPDRDVLKVIADKTKRLEKMLTILQKQGIRDPWLADVEVYHQAAVWIVQLDEFFQKESATWTLEALDRGMLRASLLGQGEIPPPWAAQAGFPVVRAYRSRIDGSVQPYAVTLPAAYGREPGKKWRLDVVLHGRDKNLNEIKFLHTHNGDQAAPKEQNFIRIDIFGRVNNAYRWAGESDVFEAVDNFLAVENGLNRGRLTDLDRAVLRGFSMGGAGTWHLGLHRPDRWCVIGPGAGFTTTHGYIRDLPEKLPYYQEACLHIYDAVDYAENAFNVPVVAYSGAEDPQKKAADNIESRLKPLGIPMTHLVAPGLKHKFPDDWKQKAEQLYAKHAEKGREEYPARVKFVTYTLRYPSCYWVEILGLERHYQKSLVDAERTESGFTIKTANVRELQLTLPAGAGQPLTVKIDSQEVAARPWISQTGVYQVFLQRRRGNWTSVLPQRLLTERARSPQKIKGLTGPIDDAFTESFLCVRGTGTPWHKAVKEYTDGSLKRFRAEWAKYWRGQLPLKDDIDVTNEDIAARHLILFGDPASNSLIAQAMDGLPVQWTKSEIAMAGQKFEAANHVPVLIYPSLLNGSRYVVLNSGHTFHAADLQNTNAWLFPRLGDYAVLRLSPTERDPLGVDVATAGLFDDFWRISDSSPRGKREK